MELNLATLKLTEVYASFQPIAVQQFWFENHQLLKSSE
jgi:hypothetical protein